jgi:hypothetical protein
LSPFCRQLKSTSAYGKSYKTEAINTEDAFRIIQSIPNLKAEPFKRWLAQVGSSSHAPHENQSIYIDQAAVFYLDEGLLTFDLMILRLIKLDLSVWLAKRKSSSSPDPTVQEKPPLPGEFLPFEADCLTFINADLIAAGLSPFQNQRLPLFALAG